MLWTKTARGVVVIAFGLAVGGAGAAQRRVQPGEHFELAHSATVEVADTGLEVRFQGVLEDSRCPENARCMWAGNARVELHVGVEGEAGESLVLNTHGGEALPSTGCAGGLELELFGLRPYPSTEGPPPADRYVATLVVRVGCARETGDKGAGGVKSQV